MKMSLKAKLILSYTALSLLLVMALLVVSNVLLEKQFSQYILQKQEEKNQSYVDAVLAEFEKNKQLTTEGFVALGQKAFNDGLILMIRDDQNHEVFCMSCYDQMRCEDMISAMERTMQSRYPGFKGEYVEKQYTIESEGILYGTVTLGYYGPYYLLDADIRFMDILNNLFVAIAFAFLAVAIMIGYFMANRLSKPIQEVTMKAKEIEKGHCDCRIDIHSTTTEIQGLINSVNALAITLDAQQNLKKRMANNYAHEFRTPLAAIQSTIEGIIDGIFDATPERLENIRQEILRLSRMVNQIDKLVELESDDKTLNKTKFDLKNLIIQVVTTFEMQCEEKKIDVSMNLVQSEIVADHDQIGSVISNLMSNAIKYTDNNGKIKIQLVNHKEMIQLIISDTGIGIAKEEIPLIFEHLYRTDISRSRKTGGSGIGLSVVRMIILNHGGDIKVDSELNKGTTFIINLPK
ncbi:MAG: ATP-binding protein [Anaerorhabdus sp.]|uniref:ATP-binding protein n=1 Tax=Anaerorhabdus sp. TaxID=1872524 RepID=UPI003A8C08AE